MKNKGQLSIEVIMLLSVFLLFFHAMILPSIDFAENTLKDTHAIIQTKKGIDNLADNIEQFSNSQGYGKRTVLLYLPNNTMITDCNNTSKQINYEINISTQKPTPVGCDVNGICKFSKQLYITNTLNCIKIGPGNSGAIVLEKTNTGNINISYQ